MKCLHPDSKNILHPLIIDARWCGPGGGGRRIFIIDRGNRSICARGSGGNWDSSLRVVFVGVGSVGSGHGRTGITRLARWPDVIVMMLLRFNGARGSRSGRGKLSISGVGVLVASEEALLSGARGIAVGGRWTITLLFLMVSHKENLEKSAEEEETTGSMLDYRHRLVRSWGYSHENDRDSKDTLLHATSSPVVGNVVSTDSIEIGRTRCSRISITQSRRDETVAATSTSSVHVGDGDEASDKEDIEDQGQSAETRETSDEASKESGDQSPEDSCTGDTLDGFDPSSLEEIVTGE